jgi:uncharacterized alpha-E superfamily protein
MVVEHLDSIAEAYGRRGESQRIAAATLIRLGQTDIDEIFQSGLHEFILGFIGDNNRLGHAVAQQYLA